MKVICHYCKKEFDLRPSKVKRAKKHFCNIECRTEYNKKFAKHHKKTPVRSASDFFNEIKVYDNYAEIKIISKKYGERLALIDIEDIDKVSKIFWHVAKYYGNYFMAVGWCKELGKEVKMHRYIMDFPINKMIDHINRNPLDNRKTNLRAVNRSENMLNKGVAKNNNLKYRGIRLHYNKYQARIAVNKKNISLGHFDTIQEAIEARERFCKENNIIC